MRSTETRGKKKLTNGGRTRGRFGSMKGKGSVEALRGQRAFRPDGVERYPCKDSVDV